jgi:glyoxylase-like metal-dependent hydrolase (beta-lactamase superfamily II)
MSSRAIVVALAAMLINGPICAAERAAPPFSEWINATDGTEPEVQVQRYDQDTFVLRQSIRTNFEGPFLYLIFGGDRALLLDSGAGGLLIRPHVESVMKQWLEEHHREAIPLVVAHSHAHRDHKAGDAEFLGRPNTTVVGLEPEKVAAFFAIQHWPDDIAQFDLGGRVLDIIATPGHEPSHMMIFDRRTRLLLSGDTLYPGRIYFPQDQLDVLKSSIDRVVAFTQSRNVAWVLGAHIEMSRKPGKDYPMTTDTHPDEHVLELPYARLLELQRALHNIRDNAVIEAHDDFILYPKR